MGVHQRVYTQSGRTSSASQGTPESSACMRYSMVSLSKLNTKSAASFVLKRPCSFPCELLFTRLFH